MELRGPKRKRWCSLESEQPFPIFIQSEIKVSIDNWLPIIYTGIFNGLGVVIKDADEINALHSMGNFGKGCCSRSRPNAMRNNPNLPDIITKRQFLHRQKWIKEKSNYKDCESAPPKLVDKLLEEINAVHTCIDNVRLVGAGTQQSSNSDVSVSNKPPVLDISSDEESLVNVTDVESDISSEKSSLLPVKCDDLVEQSIDDLIFPLNSVVVVSDSESDNEDYLQNLNPKLCVDKSKSNECLVLTLQEAYFLAFGLGCLQILDQNEKVLDLNESWELFCKTQKVFFYKYVVYHYYRSKGWIVKPGIKFGGDYLLYKEGQPFYHASYIILIDITNVSNDYTFDWKTILGLLRMAGTAAKEVVMVQVNTPKSEEPFSFLEDPRNISKCTVSEVLLRRWISNQERDDDND